MHTEDERRHGSAAPLRVESEQFEGAVVIRVAGEVDSYTAPLLRDHLVAAYAGAPGPVVVDLTDVQFFASSGLSLLVEYHQIGADRDAPLRLVSPARSVLRALRATTLTQMLEIHPTIADALSAG